MIDEGSDKATHIDVFFSYIKYSTTSFAVNSLYDFLLNSNSDYACKKEFLVYINRSKPSKV